MAGLSLGATEVKADPGEDAGWRNNRRGILLSAHAGATHRRLFQ
jgi:hypothetical protein